MGVVLLRIAKSRLVRDRVQCPFVAKILDLAEIKKCYREILVFIGVWSGSAFSPEHFFRFGNV